MKCANRSGDEHRHDTGTRSAARYPNGIRAIGSQGGASHDRDTPCTRVCSGVSYFGHAAQRGLRRIDPCHRVELEYNEDIGVLADMTDFDHMTAGALLRDLAYAMSKLGEYRRFKRAAVIADKGWIETTTRLAGKLFPNTEARLFHAGELEEAMRWVAGFRRDLIDGGL
ncbi:STAS/SEC14 domain-containing protein [Billgrantia antri]|uniref:STAS/SEC14 domain-containing protein n=1 Tax=Billgrantia antri TaxID=2846777 RepID=UPI003083FB99